MMKEIVVVEMKCEEGGGRTKKRTRAREPSERPELDLQLICWPVGSLPDLCP